MEIKYVVELVTDIDGEVSRTFESTEELEDFEYGTGLINHDTKYSYDF